MDRQFVAFDFETTGLDPFTERIVEVGAVKFGPYGDVAGTFQEMVNPEQPIDPSASAVSGITDDTVRNCPPLAAVMPEFLGFLGPADTVLFAHNAPFDTRFLAFEMARLGVPAPCYPIFDTIGIARRLVRLRSYKLGSVARALGIEQSEAHRGLADSMVVKDIVAAFARQCVNEDVAGKIAATFPVLRLADVPVRPLDLNQTHPALAVAVAETRPVNVTYMGSETPLMPMQVIPRGAFRREDTDYLSACLLPNRVAHNLRMDLIVRIDDVT